MTTTNSPALDDDFPAVLTALRRGLGDTDARKAAAVAMSYVQLVFSRSVAAARDETSSPDSLDVSAMTREQRDALKRRILARHPELVDELTS